MDNNTATSPQTVGPFSVGITTINLSSAIGIVQNVLVPEYFMCTNGPLAMKLFGHEICMWAYQNNKFVSEPFVVMVDNKKYDFSDQGLMVRRHFGTVFTEDGKALHVGHLSKIMNKKGDISRAIFYDGHHMVTENITPKSKENAFIVEVLRATSGDIRLEYEGPYLDGHRFMWTMQGGGHATSIGSFEKLSEFGLIRKHTDINWVTKVVVVSFFHKKW